MNFKKSLIASSIATASASLMPVVSNAITITQVQSPSFTSTTLDATGLDITSTGGIDLSNASFSFDAVTIPATPALTADITIAAGGFINAVSNGTTGQQTSIFHAGINNLGDLTGSITNNGTITAEDAGILFSSGSSLTGDIINGGDITSLDDAAILLDNGTVSGSITNSVGGTIDGGGVTVFNSSVTGGISNAGTMSSVGPNGPVGNDGYGLDVQNSTVGAINNSGTITGGFILDQSTMTGDFTNAGTIQSAAAGGNGYVVRGGLSDHQGDLVNTSTGTISSSDGRAVSVEQGAVLGTINNSGIINGATNGIVVTDGSSSIGTIINNAGGTITGGIVAQNAGVIGSIINDGTINGTTDFGAGGGTFDSTGSAGAVLGASSVTNDGILGDVTLIASGGIVGNTMGSTAGNVSNASSVSNAGDIGNIDFVGTGTFLGNSGSAGNVTGVDSVSNIGGSIGDITFSGSGIYASFGNTTAGTIQGASIIEFIADSGGVSTSTISGDLTFSGSILLAGVIADGTGFTQNPLIDVTGDVNINGSNVAIVIDGIAQVDQGDQFAFLQYGGTLTSDVTLATGVDVQESSLIIDFDVVESGNQLFVVAVADGTEADIEETLNEQGLDGTTGGENIQETFEALAQASGSSGSLGTVIMNIQQLSGQEQLEALESLAPETVEGGALSALAADTVAASTIDNRTSALRGFYGFSGAVAGDPMSINGFWVQGYNNETDQGVRDGVDGFDADTYGVALGADAPFGERVVAGLALSYADTDVDMKQATRNSLQIDSIRLAAYGSYNADDYYMDGQVAYASNSYDTERFIVPISQVAKGDHDGDQYSVRVRGGYPIATDSGLFITPNAGVNYTYLQEDGYTETGAGNAGLTIDTDDVEVLVLSLGVKFAYPVTTKNEVTWIPEFSLTYAYDTIGDEVEIDSNFVGVTGAAFITNGANVEQEAIKAGLKVRAFSQGNFSFAAGYDYVDKKDYDSQSLTATVRYDF